MEIAGNFVSLEGPLQQISSSQVRTVQVRPTLIMIWTVVMLVSGCSSLQRIQSDMTVMTENVGLIASEMPAMTSSMDRLVSSMERMHDEVEAGIDSISAASPKIEPYLKAYDKSDKALIDQLEGIRRELAQMKMAIGAVHKQGTHETYSPTYKEREARLEKIGAALDHLSKEIQAGKQRLE